MLDVSLAKMAELKFEAPLAQFEDGTDEFFTNGISSTAAGKLTTKQEKDAHNNAQITTTTTTTTCASELINNSLNISRMKTPQTPFLLDGTIASSKVPSEPEEDEEVTGLNGDNPNGGGPGVCPPGGVPIADEATNFTETFSGSLEDLVNNFDAKITKCFGNYGEPVEQLAPVQVRTQEEIMNECQVWWTITGNFGNILPIDWTKTSAQQQSTKSQKTAMNNNEKMMSTTEEVKINYNDEETNLSNLHLTSSNNGYYLQDTGIEPFKTADEVLREIDDIIQEGYRNDCLEKAREVLNAPLYEDKLRTLNTTQLSELYIELEALIREFSETLIAELALRDELEYEKELKNTFISLLLAVQNKRRQYHVTKKRTLKELRSNGTAATTSPTNNKLMANVEPKYLTTVIPYHLDSGNLNNPTLQILIKILKAIHEDSPTVPTLLTDYILKVICPT